MIESPSLPPLWALTVALALILAAPAAPAAETAVERKPVQKTAAVPAAEKATADAATDAALAAAAADAAQEAADAAVAAAHAAAAAADTDTDDTAEETGPADTEEPERPIIERSLVLAPEQAGDFTLIAAQDYPGQPAAGVGLRYRHDDFPEVIIDLYVYPFGRGARDEVMPVVMDAIRDELREVEASGDYADLEFGDVETFDLQRVDVDGSLLAQRPPVSADAGSDDNAPAATAAATDDASADEGLSAADQQRLLAAMDAAHTAALAATDADIGRRMPIRVSRRGEPAQSLAFLFYRSLYLHKGRISTTLDVASDNFERLANRAMADIVPRVIVRNTGDCAQRTLVMTADDVAGSDADNAVALATRMAAGSVRSASEGCADPLDESVPAGYRALPLDVRGIWAPPPRAPGKNL